jgi:sugar phosphate isomerase/epimerase
MVNLSRRQFVKTSGTVAALASLGVLNRCAPAKAPAKEIPVGVQLYSVRSEMQKDVPATLAAMAKIGYQGVEFAGFFDYAANDLKKLLDDNGLQCCGSHTPIDTLSDEAFDATIEYNKVIGNKYIIVPWISEEDRSTIENWKKLAEKFNAWAEKLKGEGMHVGYHNHTFEFQAIDGQLPWDVFAQNTNNDVVLQLDTANCGHGKADPLATLKRYPGRATTVHLKEYSTSNENAILGEGDVPWKEVLSFCKSEGGTEWYIIEEEKDTYPPIEAVTKCFQNLQALRA